MFEDFDFSMGDSANIGVEYSNGDFYVRSSGRVSATPNSVSSTAASVSFAPTGTAAAHSLSHARALSVGVSRGIGNGASSSFAYVGLF
jgi:hypothetical protein